VCQQPQVIEAYLGAEVERVIAAQPNVAEAAILGVPDQRLGQVGRAIVVPEPGGTVDLDAIMETLRQSVSTYKIPHHWEIRVEPLPRTASGKVRKYLLANDGSAAG
jgi:acyl-CoA synthetase (AMP-forming)/AMP-acid ligase II